DLRRGGIGELLLRRGRRGGGGSGGGDARRCRALADAGEQRLEHGKLAFAVHASPACALGWRRTSASPHDTPDMSQSRTFSAPLGPVIKKRARSPSRAKRTHRASTFVALVTADARSGASTLSPSMPPGPRSTTRTSARPQRSIESEPKPAT